MIGIHSPSYILSVAQLDTYTHKDIHTYIHIQLQATGTHAIHVLELPYYTNICTYIHICLHSHTPTHTYIHTRTEMRKARKVIYKLFNLFIRTFSVQNTKI